MINVQQLRELIIRPALRDLVMYSEDAEELLVFTCAVESNGGSFLKQIQGPALGIYQMEPETYNDIWQNYLFGKANLYMKLLTNFQCNRMPDEYRLIYDLRFATAMTRVHYARISLPLPHKDDTHALWAYYKSHYNSSLGKSQEDESLLKYQAYINS